MYSSTLSLTLVLNGGEWTTPLPGHFTPGKDPVPIVQEAGWAPGPSGRVWKISPPQQFDSRTVQPVASRYTDCAIVYGNIYIYIYIVQCRWYNDLATGLAVRVSNPKSSKKFYSSPKRLYWLRIHQTSSPGFPPGGKEKRQESEFDHSLPSIAEVKNEWSYPCSPSSTYLHGVGRDNYSSLISKRINIYTLGNK